MAEIVRWAMQRILACDCSFWTTTFVSSKAQDQETDNRTKFTVRLPCPIRYTQCPVLYSRTRMTVLGGERTPCSMLEGVLV